MRHSRHKTQCDEILAILLRACGAWVPLPEILELAAQYNARIHQLRKQGYRIENRKEGKRRSYFRLVGSTISAGGQRREALVHLEPTGGEPQQEEAPLSLFPDLTPSHRDLG